MLVRQRIEGLLTIRCIECPRSHSPASSASSIYHAAIFKIYLFFYDSNIFFSTRYLLILLCTDSSLLSSDHLSRFTHSHSAGHSEISQVFLSYLYLYLYFRSSSLVFLLEKTMRSFFYFYWLGGASQPAVHAAEHTPLPQLRWHALRAAACT